MSRYRMHCGAEGAGNVDASNLLPERVDPITLKAVVSCHQPLRPRHQRRHLAGALSCF